MESLEALNSPSIGESKSSIRKIAEATQIAQITIDMIDNRVAWREKAKNSENDRQPRAHRHHERPRDRVMRRLKQLTPGAQRLVDLS